MPLVEVLPNSAASVAPGWTYVVDRGYDPSKVAINPKNKKRAAAQPKGPRGDNELTSRQQLAVQRRIAELNRDNDPKQTIEVPGKPSPPKTQNARRIIQYQRQIKHWLDDEEAQLALQQQGPVPRSTTAALRTTAPSGRSSAAASIPQTPSEPATAPVPPPTRSEMLVDFEDDALLSVEESVPPPIDPAELAALLAAPPLPYAASFVGPPPANGPPKRHFCDNCGYWGQIKCLKCGARVCGLECKDAHEATRCLNWA